MSAQLELIPAITMLPVIIHLEHTLAHVTLAIQEMEGIA